MPEASWPIRCATVTQALIFLKDENGLFPALQQYDGKPFLAWLIRELQRYGVQEVILRCTAPLPDSMLHSVTSTLPRPATIQVLSDTNFPENHMKLHSRILVCQGETIFGGNIASLLAAATEKTGSWQIVRPHDDRQSELPLLIQGAALPSTLWSVRNYHDLLGKIGSLRSLPVRGMVFHVDQSPPCQSLAATLNRPAIFLDRDGVINEDHGWIGSRDRFVWTKDLFPALRNLTERGYHVFIVTNQSGIARGLYTEEQLHDLMEWMIDQIRAAGATIDDWRYCPYHPQAPLDAFRRASAWRKPAPGMILDLARHWQPDMTRSYLYGDQNTDLEAARNAGLPGIQVGQLSLAELLQHNPPPLAPCIDDETASQGT